MARLLLSVLLISLLTGCSSIDTQVDPSRDVGAVQRFFVVANANDSRALDRQIVIALRARGRTAESGPRTMQPEDTQAVVTYADNWTWDFGDRLMYLQITVREATSDQPIGTLQYRVKIPGRQPPAEIIADLIGGLLDGGK